MPDASGTPTSPDNIPTYNTAVDPPSGKGFNTAMAQIQTIITELKAGTLPSGKLAAASITPGTNGQVLVTSSGVTTWGSAGLKTTVSTMAGGPPGSPADTDVWIATAVDANGLRWMFQYNAGSGSSFKWEFLGSLAAFASVVTSESTASTTLVDLATIGPSITVARAGDYQADFGFQANNNSGANASGTLVSNGVTLGLPTAITQAVSSSGGLFTAMQVNRANGVSAGAVLKLQYNTSNGVSTTFQNRWLRVTPIRIS